MGTAKANFASYMLRRVEAEVLIDALNNITGGSDLHTSAVPEPFTYIPRDMSAVQLADGSVVIPAPLRPYMGGMEIIRGI